MEITIGYKIDKPIETQEQCDAYTEMAEAVNSHNNNISDGEYFWTISDLENEYCVTKGELYQIVDILDSVKEAKVQQSKEALAEYLASHPMEWIDGEHYSVTEQKQSLLTSNLALYQISVASGSPRELKWNTTGDKCKTWTYENLAALSLAIGDYVQPFVSRQQDLEIQIKNCATMEELDAIEISYE